MKVIVCFNDVSVVVPCGEGRVSVEQLINEAVARYRRVSAKNWIRVLYLKSSDGGLLDPDDPVCDVVDDRERLIATFEEVDDVASNAAEDAASQTGRETRGTKTAIEERLRVDPDMERVVLERMDSGGDGTSYGSSTGTPSPSGGSFRELGGPSRCTNARGSSSSQQHDEQVQQRCSSSSSSSLVQSDSCYCSCASNQPQAEHSRNRPCCRTGEELNAVHSRVHSLSSSSQILDMNKTLTSSQLLEDSGGGRGWMGEGVDEKLNYPAGRQENHVGQDFEDDFNVFVRSTARKSLNTNLAMMNWLDAQERIQQQHEMGLLRADPVGSSDEAELNEAANQAASCDLSTGTLVVLENTGGPLGIHVVPCFDGLGNNIGLKVNEVDSSGRVFKDGRIRAGDRITRINGFCVVTCDFNRAQEIFRGALKSPYIKLHVVYGTTSDSPLTSKCLPSSPHHSVDGRSFVSELAAHTKVHNRTSSLPILNHSSSETIRDGEIHARLEPTAARLEKTTETLSEGKEISTSSKQKFTVINNTRVIGRVLNIALTKGSEGLGFSVTTRDNIAGGDSPVYIKNILSQGAAIRDGRLRAGDRLLRVNDIDMAGKNQEDVVAILRSVKVNESVDLVISRQHDDDDVINSDNVGSSRMSKAVSSTNLQMVSSGTAVDVVDKDLRTKVMTADLADDESNRMNAETGDAKSSSRKQKLVSVADISMVEPGIQGGLGLSVKGRTFIKTDSSGEEGERQDVGLFIKKISANGAAEKDGRLMVDDRLIEVNGISLLGYKNSHAMDVLRNAMLMFGPKPQSVSLVVSRTVPSAEVQESSSSEVTGKTINSAHNPVKSSRKSSAGGSLDGTDAPVRKNVPHPNRYSRRNISYQQANYDKLFSTDIPAEMWTEAAVGEKGGGNEDIEVARSSRSDSESVLDSNLDSSFGDFDAKLVFDRHAAGRRSVSEKRKGHMDPKLLQFYQQVKTIRGGAVNGGALKRTVSAVSLVRAKAESEGQETSPSYHTSDEAITRALKRCSSLESVHSMMIDAGRNSALLQASNPSEQRRRGQQRARGVASRWNESFRVAIDKSYEMKLALAGTIYDDDDGTGSLSSSSLGQGQTSRGSSQNSQHSLALRLAEKKDKGLLKSLGGLLGIGKTRKDEERNNSKERNKGTCSETEHRQRSDDIMRDAVHSTNGRRRSDTTLSSDRLLSSDSSPQSHSRVLKPSNQSGVTGAQYHPISSSTSSGFYSCSQQNLMAEKKSNTAALEQPGSWLKSKAAYRHRETQNLNPLSSHHSAVLSSSRDLRAQSDSDYFSSSDDCRRRRRHRDTNASTNTPIQQHSLTLRHDAVDAIPERNIIALDRNANTVSDRLYKSPTYPQFTDPSTQGSERLHETGGKAYGNVALNNFNGGGSNEESHKTRSREPRSSSAHSSARKHLDPSAYKAQALPGGVTKFTGYLPHSHDTELTVKQPAASVKPNSLNIHRNHAFRDNSSAANYQRNRYVETPYGSEPLINPQLVNPQLVNPQLANPQLVNPRLVNSQSVPVVVPAYRAPEENAIPIWPHHHADINYAISGADTHIELGSGETGYGFGSLPRQMPSRRRTGGGYVSKAAQV